MGQAEEQTDVETGLPSGPQSLRGLKRSQAVGATGQCLWVLPLVPSPFPEEDLSCWGEGNQGELPEVATLSWTGKSSQI